MGPTALFTIVAKNYLPAARVLMQSVKEHHPEFARFVLLVDDPADCFDPEAEDFVVDTSSNLAIADSRLFHLKYTILELSTAVKPHYFQALFAGHAFETILYLDPDILLYDRLSPVLDALGDQNIVLTPHLTDALDDGRRPGEYEILRSGAYNLGFIAVRRSATTMRFLRWWQQRLANDCIARLPWWQPRIANDGLADADGTLFVDQRWADLVPGMFADVAILRDPGLNVAYWNLPHRALAEEDGRYTVNGVSLRFFHFSGFRADHPHTLSRFQDRYLADFPEPLATIAADYRQRLLAAGFMECKEWPYAYGQFHDGTPIPDVCRRIIRDDPALQALLAPMDAEGQSREALHLLNLPWRDAAPEEVVITQLAHQIYEHRHDAQVAFPHLTGTDRHRFASWFINEAALQYQLPAVFVEPVAASLDSVSWHTDAPRAWLRHGRAPLRHGALQMEADALDRSRVALGAAADTLRERYAQFGAWAETFFANPSDGPHDGAFGDRDGVEGSRG